MKPSRLFFAAISLLIISSNAQAQTKDSTTYFLGSWNVLVKGLPNGDTKMFVNLEKGDTTMTGAILDSMKTEVAKFSKVERRGFTVTVYFVAQGYDVTLFMEKKDEDHVMGSLMAMFEAEGVRVKDEK